MICLPLSYWLVAAAIAAAAGFALGYVWGQAAGVAKHRTEMRDAAAEWRACWLGDPPKASQSPPGEGRRARGERRRRPARRVTRRRFAD